jgi:hypothetical protein
MPPASVPNSLTRSENDDGLKLEWPGSSDDP